MDWVWGRTTKRSNPTCPFCFKHVWKFLPLEIPMTTVGEMAEVGFDSNKITGKKGILDIESGCSDSDTYPCLWHVKANAQWALLVRPDSHGIIRSDCWDQAQKVLSRNSRVITWQS